MAQFELMQGPRWHRLLDQRASPICFYVDFFVIICVMAAHFLTFCVVVAFLLFAPLVVTQIYVRVYDVPSERTQDAMRHMPGNLDQLSERVAEFILQIVKPG
jgi:hypothetical protein